MKAETIRLSIDRAMMMDASIQCNCRNKHSFWFVPVAYHPIFKVKMVYGLLISCNVPVETGDGWEEFVYDDEWLYMYSILRIDEKLGVISITKVGEDMKIDSIIEFPLKDVKDIVTLTEKFDDNCQSVKRIMEVVKHDD